ncbi:MAG: helix-turn-helix transcriptional regulator, partial [Candidatus Dormibacteraeota bacterium]|nr:helix-turn-helix transcriptional regulator [Candidatus Dormibacteraeota bacterium]
QEVARMVAQGLTNAQIAERLGIGRRTAESHIQHVRNRLGLSSRAELAAWSAVSLGETAG